MSIVKILHLATIKSGKYSMKFLLLCSQVCDSVNYAHQHLVVYYLTSHAPFSVACGCSSMSMC